MLLSRSNMTSKRKNITSKEAANEWLRLNHPKFEVTHWGGSGQSKDTVILDKERNISFSYSFMRFKDKVQKNPNREFGIPKEEITKKARRAMVDKYGVSSPLQIKEFKEKAENTTLKRFGVRNVMYSDQFRSSLKNSTIAKNIKTLKEKEVNENNHHHTSSPEFKEKLKRSLIEKYGVDNVFKIKEVQEKMKNTMLEKYGESHPSKVKEIHSRQVENIKKSSDVAKKKRQKTMIERYGDANPSNIESIREKTIQTNIKKYGVANPQQNKEIREKTKDTSRKIYGSDHFFSSEIGKKAAIESKIKNGQIRTYQGKLISDVAKEKGYSKSHFGKLVRENGIEEAIKSDPNKTFLESKISQLLSDIKVEFIFNKQLKGSSCRPDFLIEPNKLIIECDGLYWHSEAVISDKSYHKKKLETYESMGYRVLFFRSDEIENNFDIVKSIILNSLKMNKNRIFARKCDLKENDSLSREFVAKNHLMGEGKGRIYSLSHKGEIVAAMQIKCVNKDTKTFEISRYCTKNETSVVGAFSKLLKFAISKENADYIVTFIDRRYGNGDYLSSMGFIKSGNHCSFKWTNGEKTFNRMTFPGSSGIENGFVRIYDAGQQKYVMSL